MGSEMCIRDRLIYSGGASIRLKNSGEIELNGRVEISGEAFVNGRRVLTE